MDEINAVQYDIFKAFHSVCEKLSLKYYLVHGSLLGALRYQGFAPMDDDIDVAMPRKDYDILMEQGQKYFDDRFFVQSHLSEREYPLLFGKIRANNTAFIQPVLKNCNVHKGIYIDIFPIDNYPANNYTLKKLKFIEGILARRVNRRLNNSISPSFRLKLTNTLWRIVLPSWDWSRDKLCALYRDVKPSGMVIVRGGKAKEVGIPFSLFGEPVKIKFNEIDSYAPNNTDAYLTLIYGDYMNYEPMGRDMVSSSEVKISADIVDVQKSYRSYE